MLPSQFTSIMPLWWHNAEVNLEVLSSLPITKITTGIYGWSRCKLCFTEKLKEDMKSSPGGKGEENEFTDLGQCNLVFIGLLKQDCMQ